MSFIDYSSTNPPAKRGNAWRIYQALASLGTVQDLHYNPNNWGRDPEGGWGTWACELLLPPGRSVGRSRHSFTGFCGIIDGRVYLQGNRAPYPIWFVDNIGTDPT